MKRLVLLGLLLAACGSKGPPRAPGAAAPPEALVRPAEPCADCVVTEPQPGLLHDDGAPIAPEAVPPADEPEGEGDAAP